MVAPFTHGCGAAIRLAAAPLTCCNLLPVYTLPVVSMFRRPVTTGRFQRAASPLHGFPRNLGRTDSRDDPVRGRL